MIGFGHVICGDSRNSSRGEWLITNGIGGYLSGTMACALLRPGDTCTLVASTRPDPDLDGDSVIAEYPWFTDWVRDTMISLPGLTPRYRAS